MSDSIYERETIRRIVKPIAEKYRIQNVYLFGSYARGEATYSSDLDFLVYGGEQFKRTMIFAFAEELRKALEKNVDVDAIKHIAEQAKEVLITHKKRTMEYIDTLYGITMQESGVSKRVSVKLGDINK